MSRRMLVAAAVGLGLSTGAWAMPVNDLIVDAIFVGPGPGSIAGTTSGATVDSGAPLSGTSVTAPGVWYGLFGTGDVITLDTCTGTTYDSKISVYSDYMGSLSGLTAEGGNDDHCGLQSSVDFSSAAGKEYWILVHGFGSASGNFTLTYSGAGDADVPLPAPALLLLTGLGALAFLRRTAPRV